jgi:hypothetical protein
MKRKKASLVRRVMLDNSTNSVYVNIYFKRSQTQHRIDIGCIGTYLMRFRLPLKNIAQLSLTSERKIREIC